MPQTTESTEKLFHQRPDTARYEDAVRAVTGCASYRCGARQRRRGGISSNWPDMGELPDPGLRPHVFEIARATAARRQDTRDNLRALLVAARSGMARFRRAPRTQQLHQGLDD